MGIGHEKKPLVAEGELADALAGVAPQSGSPQHGELADALAGVAPQSGSPQHSASVAATSVKRTLIFASLTLLALVISTRLRWGPPAMRGSVSEGSSDTMGLAAGTFSKLEGLNCYPHSGANLLSDGRDQIGRMTKSQCISQCLLRSECEGILFVSNRDFGWCWLRKDIDASRCIKGTVWDLYTKTVISIPQQDVADYDAPTPAPAYPEPSTTAPAHPEPSTTVVSASFSALPGYDCWGASSPAPGIADAIPGYSVDACKAACSEHPQCEGFIIGQVAKHGQCSLRTGVNLPACKPNVGYGPQAWDFYLRQKSNVPALSQPSGAPVHEFYMYRATAPGNLARYTLGEVNTGNLDGVLWYLSNEIVTVYSGPPRCPRRFDISKVHRFKVKVRPTLPLAQEHMSFGVRFAFDQGRCSGRCFPKNLCTGRGDCAYNFDKYGHVVGCNRFDSRYPFPDEETKAYVSTPNGVWYSLPIEGRCEGDPTGTRDCTWSYEEAGVLALEEIESLKPGGSNCCNGKCTNFWAGGAAGDTSWRSGQVMDMFARKFPQWPRDLPAPPCDFDAKKWYPSDTWPRQSPWR